jgi:hypothetical protein
MRQRVGGRKLHREIDGRHGHSPWEGKRKTPVISTGASEFTHTRRAAPTGATATSGPIRQRIEPRELYILTLPAMSQPMDGVSPWAPVSFCSM